jgi:hypothetical protein
MRPVSKEAVRRRPSRKVPTCLHDGSAATLTDVLVRTRGQMGDITSLSAGDLAAPVEYLRSL